MWLRAPSSRVHEAEPEQEEEVPNGISEVLPEVSW